MKPIAVNSNDFPVDLWQESHEAADGTVREDTRPPRFSNFSTFQLFNFSTF